MANTTIFLWKCFHTQGSLFHFIWWTNNTMHNNIFMAVAITSFLWCWSLRKIRHGDERWIHEQTREVVLSCRCHTRYERCDFDFFENRSLHASNCFEDQALHMQTFFSLYCSVVRFILFLFFIQRIKWGRRIWLQVVISMFRKPIAPCAESSSRPSAPCVDFFVFFCVFGVQRTSFVTGTWLWVHSQPENRQLLVFFLFTRPVCFCVYIWSL